MMEYEVKIRVADLRPIRDRLASLGIRPASRQTERDLYFNSPFHDFGRTDEALRIRSTDGETTLSCSRVRSRPLTLSTAADVHSMETPSSAAYPPLAQSNEFVPSSRSLPCPLSPDTDDGPPL